MRPIVMVASLLIGMGAVALALPTLTYTEREDIVDIGPLEVTTEAEETIPIPPVLGGLAIAGGVALLLVGRRRTLS